tara:strand:- start:152 stop:292 length:141 start_codon:yes stop_codon:yes gene_type:complete
MTVHKVLSVPLDISQLKTKRKELKQSLLRMKKKIGREEKGEIVKKE